MASRLELQEELEQILGSRNVYFEPPESLKMKYPCIRYSRSAGNKTYANNRLYLYKNHYDLMVIDPDSESEISMNILNHFSMCSDADPYSADNLWHFPLDLYY